jgi:hypothetical protein
VIALREAFLTAWERYRAALDAVTGAGSPEAAADRRKQAEVHAAEVRVRYADLVSQVREELEQGNDPWWRRWRPTRGRRVSSEEEPAARARPA